MPSRKKKLIGLKDFYKAVDADQTPLTYLCSEEPFFIEEALRYLKMTTLQPESQDFNYDLFYGRETALSKVFDVIETLPMMAQKRLVVIRNAHELRETDWNTLFPAISNPSPSSCVVFIGKKLDGRKKYVKNILAQLNVFDFAKPYENEIPNWIRYICQKHQLTIDNEAVRLCQQIVGNRLIELENEIMKMSLFAGEGQTITGSTVMEVASRIKLQSVFDLTNAIGKRDRSRALTCLVELLENGQNEIGILAMVQRHIRLLKQTRSGEKQGYRGKQLSSYAGVPHFFLNEYRNQASLWTERKIEKTFRALLDTDKALKSSPVSKHIWLENFILQSCS